MNENVKESFILTLSNVSICSADNCPLGRSCDDGMGVGEGVGRPDVSGDFSLSISPTHRTARYKNTIYDIRYLLNV